MNLATWSHHLGTRTATGDGMAFILPSRGAFHFPSRDPTGIQILDWLFARTGIQFWIVCQALCQPGTLQSRKRVTPFPAC